MNSNSEKSQFLNLLSLIKEIAEGPAARDPKLLETARLLKRSVAHYDWVGFYVFDQSSRNELVLGPFAGEPTEHTRIPFGKGICGQAAIRGESFIVDDVSKETNYLSCSPRVKSEIVVPVFKDGDVVAELDIDSHKLSPFTEDEKNFLERACSFLSSCF